MCKRLISVEKMMASKGPWLAMPFAQRIQRKAKGAKGHTGFPDVLVSLRSYVLASAFLTERTEISAYLHRSYIPFYRGCALPYRGALSET